MSTYRFSLHNYHAISHADIDLDSISVIAGINGTGKSTISRWMYYLVCGMTEYVGNCRKSIMDAALTISTSCTVNLAEVRREEGKVNSLSATIQNVDVKSFDFDEQLLSAYQLFIEDLRSDINFVLANLDDSEKKRIFKALLNSYDKTYKITDYQETAADIIIFVQNTFNAWFEQYKEAINDMNSGQLRKQILSAFKEGDSFPTSIGLSEEGVQLYSNDFFKTPLTLKRTVYIDSPMVLSEQADGARGVIWQRLTDLLKVENRHNEVAAAFINEINDVIGGKVECSVDPITKVSALTYQMPNGRKIKIADAATGIKSFAYIIRLLECGLLDDGTLLIIDEPEAHLHPQWIVDYARILVLLAKNYGVKIITASHSSTMVSAIKYIAEKMNLDDVRFYNAEEAEDGMYDFVCHGNDIEEIFHSFNLSFEKLDEYAE